MGPEYIGNSVHAPERQPLLLHQEFTWAPFNYESCPCLNPIWQHCLLIFNEKKSQKSKSRNHSSSTLKYTYRPKSHSSNLFLRKLIMGNKASNLSLEDMYFRLHCLLQQYINCSAKRRSRIKETLATSKKK